MVPTPPFFHNWALDQPLCQLLGIWWWDQRGTVPALGIQSYSRESSAGCTCRHSLNPWSCWARAGHRGAGPGRAVVASCPREARILEDKGLTECSEIILKPTDTKCRKGSKRDKYNGISAIKEE